MKKDSTEKQESGSGGAGLLIKLFILLLVVPVLVPVSGLFIQALTWRFLLCRIEGIDFMGGLHEAFALSLALVGFNLVVNWIIGSLPNLARQIRGLPQEKPAKRKVADQVSWDDINSAIPRPRMILQQLAVNTLALVAFSTLQPVRIHFEGFMQMLLAASVLSVTWTSYFIVITAAMYAVLMHEQKTRKARGKAAET